MDPSGTQGPTAIAISIVFAVVAFFVISLRLFSRIAIVRSAGVDDGKFYSFLDTSKALIVGC
jgi:hypothetical protein